MTSLHVICDLAPPLIKNSGYAYAGSFYLLYMHCGVRLDKIFKCRGHGSKLKFRITVRVVGGKAPSRRRQ